MTTRRVLVVGGGIAGLSFAVAARRRGIAVELVELEPKVLGMGIFLTGSTLRALDSIGLAHRCVDEGWPTPSMRLFAGDGTFIADNAFAGIVGNDLPVSAGIPRPTLARILLEAAREAGAHVRIGMTVDALEDGADGVIANLSDGSIERYDAVVGADGIYSHVRTLTFGPEVRPTPAGQGGWRFITERHPEIDRVLLYSVGGLKAGFIPLDERSMYLLCTMPDPGKIRVGADRAVELFRDLMAPFTAPLIREVCARLDEADPATVMWRPFETLLLEDGWSRGRIVLIGDAAHSMTPHLTSGGGTAIEDAVVLAYHLASDRPVAAALDDFYRQRIGRVRKIQGISEMISQEEISANPSRDRIYGLTTEGYDALAEPFMVDESSSMVPA